ncbi:MAG: serine hydrolase, partial [Pedobacter sp.]
PYSNTNYVLLASVVEKVSGKTYADFIATNIFIPLHMSGSFVSDHTPYENRQLAVGYMRDSLQRRVRPEQLSGFEPLHRTSGLVGSMGIFSTASDLYKWITNFKSLLSNESYQQLILAPTFPDSKRYDRYGFGFELGYEKDFSAILFHTGRWPGYSSYLEYAPATGKTIILLQNDYNPDSGNLIESIKNVLYEVHPHRFIQVDSVQLSKLTGTYRLGNGSTRTILFQGGKLLVAMNEQVRFVLKPISTTQFIVDGFTPQVQYDFILNAGQVEKYINAQPETGTRYEAFKIK